MPRKPNNNEIATAKLLAAILKVLEECKPGIADAMKKALQEIDVEDLASALETVMDAQEYTDPTPSREVLRNTAREVLQ